MQFGLPESLQDRVDEATDTDKKLIAVLISERIMTSREVNLNVLP